MLIAQFGMGQAFWVWLLVMAITLVFVIGALTLRDLGFQRGFIFVIILGILVSGVVVLAWMLN